MDELQIANAVLDATNAYRATIERLTHENLALESENYRLRRDLGRARLLADLRRDATDIRAEFNLSPEELPALLRPQI